MISKALERDEEYLKGKSIISTATVKYNTVQFSSLNVKSLLQVNNLLH